LQHRGPSRLTDKVARQRCGTPAARLACRAPAFPSANAAAGYNPRWAVSTWLYRILTNVCVDELRRRATRTAHDERSAAGPLSSTNHRPPDAYLDLHRALERVPREARVLLALRYVDGLSYGELARIRGITINTVKSQLARGKALLRDKLGKRGAGHE